MPRSRALARPAPARGALLAALATLAALSGPIACGFDSAALDDAECVDGICERPEELDSAPSSIPSVTIGPDTDRVDSDDRICTPGEARCEGDMRIVCNPAGDRFLELDCRRAVHCVAGVDACVCLDGLCTPEACDPGATACEGTTLLRCEAGAFVPVDDCADTPGGTCVEQDGEAGCTAPVPSCDPGERRCAERREAIEVCDHEGTRFVTESSCEPNTYCDAETLECLPQVCRPGSITCEDDTTLRLCNDRGNDASASACDPGLVCAEDDEGARCSARRCEDGALRCGSPGHVERCEEDAWVREETCGDDESCRSGACEPRICVPFTIRCLSDGSREICAPSGLQHDPFPCGDGETCTEGVCRPRICTPGPFCDEDGNVRTCDETGSEDPLTETCPFTCDDGSCQPSRCGDGIVDTERGETCDIGDATALCSGCEDCQRRRQLRLTSQSRTTGFARWEPDRSDITLSAWVRPDSAEGFIAGIGNPRDGDFFAISLREGRPRVRYRTNNRTTITATATNTVPLGQWIHIAGVRYDERGAALYVNGVRVAIRTVASSGGSRIDDDDRIWIGARTGSDTALAGRLGSVHLQRSAAVRSSRFFPARFDSPTDTTIALYTFHGDSGTTVRDVSGQNRHLTLADAQLVDDDCFGHVSSARCGDGLRAPWEQCDPADPAAPDDCTDQCTSPSACDGEVGPDGACYLFSVDIGRQSTARARCSAWGGTLASIGNAEVDVWIRSRMGDISYWIGLFTRNSCDRCDNRTWEWVDGRPVTYTNWAPGEPNNFGLFNAEDCVESAPGGWNDVRCNGDRRYVCRR
ncbi:MAG: hypothetical protein EA398_03745 [Deltaproteobacteria bacterium]|nr:MAG: hypothetical protein EA398_03745 [Deltaproteobacteria bacterium]